MADMEKQSDKMPGFDAMDKTLKEMFKDEMEADEDYQKDIMHGDLWFEYLLQEIDIKNILKIKY